MQTSEFPTRLTLELTNHCNYSCVMCPARIDPHQPRGYMRPGLFRRLVDEAAEHTPLALVPFFRGESLMHPDILNLLSYAKSKGLGPIQLASNAALLDQRMAKGLLDTGLDFISFSLDSDSELDYQSVRPGGDLDQVVRNVEFFLNELRKGKYATKVQVSAVKTDHNVRGVKALISYWRSQADRVRLYVEHSSDGHPGSLPTMPWIKAEKRRPCHKVFSEMVVYFDGQVAACNHDWFREPALGDLTGQGIGRVWRSRAYKDLRGQHLEPGKLGDELCRHCDHWIVSYLDPPFIGELYTGESD